MERIDPLERLWGKNGLTSASLGRLFDRMHASSADWADLYFQEIESRDWLLEEGLLKTGSFTIDRGAGFRTVTGEKTALAYTSRLSLDALEACAATTGSMTAHGRSGAAPLFHEAHVVPRYAPARALSEESADAQTALLARIDAEARALDPRVSDVIVTYQTERDAVVVVRADGRILADERPLAYLSITIQVASGGRREQASAGGGARADFNWFTPARVSHWIRQALDEALHNLEATPAPAGVMPVVLGPGWPGILLHEAIGHGLEGDFIRKGSSVFTDLLGERIASPGVTVVDDGTLEGRRGSLSFDDEGEPSSRTMLIEDGILTGFLEDLTSARLRGVRPTGNGRRESFSTTPLPRMTNTFMLAGPYDPEEIIRSVDRGIYASNFNGGQVDITNGQFVFNMSRAWLIEKGRITRPVRGAMLIGSGAEALRHIPMVGHDLALDDGTGQCGKDGQNVPVGVGMPTIRIDALTVGGTEH